MNRVDRLFWITLRRLWSRWTSVLVIVKPDTVIAWHHAGFRLYWRWRSRPGGGRPEITEEVRGLIQTRAYLAIGQTTLFGATEDEGTGVAWVVYDLPRAAVQQLGPYQLALVHPAAQSAREQQFLRMELLDHRQTRPGPLKGLKEQAHRGLHLGVRIEHGTILRVVHKAGGHHLFEFTAPGSAQDAASQPCLEHM